MIPAEAERLVPVISDAVTSTGPKPIPARGGGRCRPAYLPSYPAAGPRGSRAAAQQPGLTNSAVTPGSQATTTGPTGPGVPSHRDGSAQQEAFPEAV